MSGFYIDIQAHECAMSMCNVNLAVHALLFLIGKIVYSSSPFSQLPWLGGRLG